MEFAIIENDILDDDVEIVEIIDVGLPRQVYERAEYFNSFDEPSFFKRFRLKKATALEVLRQIEVNLEFPSDRNNSVSPINQLLVALRFYATGNHLLSIADFSGVHTSTACRIVHRVSRAIALLAPRYIKFPSTVEGIQDCQRRFFDIAAFPRVIGAIDGTHIRIQSPGGNDAEVFRNRKRYFSINVQAVNDANLKIQNLVVRWPGSVHDSTIFNNSNLRAQFENGNFPNCILLGDAAYPIKPYLLTPIADPIGNAQQQYNNSHIRTRNSVERLFGVWKRRFPVNAYGCRLKLENTLIVIVATAVLHNVAQDMGEVDVPPAEGDEHLLDRLILEGQIPPVPHPDHGNLNLGNVQATLINEYFAHL